MENDRNTELARRVNVFDGKPVDVRLISKTCIVGRNSRVLRVVLCLTYTPLNKEINESCRVKGPSKEIHLDPETRAKETHFGPATRASGRSMPWP